MAQFDPYYKWLGIPVAEQPPNYYRLLGVIPGEQDTDVIEAAADRTMAYIRQFANGEHSDASQALLNHLSQARVCLLNPQTKSSYDEQLFENSSGSSVATEQAD